MRKISILIALVLLVSSLSAATPDEGKVRERAAATIIQMQTIDTAIAAYISDYNAPPKAADMAELAKLLVPTYLREVPMADAWGTPFRYVVDGNDYRIISAGADRKFDATSASGTPLSTSDASKDAVMANGTWVVIWAFEKGELGRRNVEVEKETQHQKAIMDRLPESERMPYFWKWATLREMDDLAVAIGKYAKEKKRYPRATTMAELKAALFPDYIEQMKTEDHWQTPYRYSVSADGMSYTLVCAGSDKTFRPDSWTTTGEFESDAEDAVIRDGKWIRGWKLPK
jgi:hypothetical protein